MAGALRFKLVGYVAIVPLVLMLIALVAAPIADDLNGLAAIKAVAVWLLCSQARVT